MSERFAYDPDRGIVPASSGSRPSEDGLRKHLAAIRALVDEQAEDEGLWGFSH